MIYKIDVPANNVVLEVTPCAMSFSELAIPNSNSPSRIAVTIPKKGCRMYRYPPPGRRMANRVAMVPDLNVS